MRFFVKHIFIFFLLVTLSTASVRSVTPQNNHQQESAKSQETTGELNSSFIDSPELLKEIDRLEKKYPEQSGAPKYERSGHQYTTYIVAMAAGLRPERAYILSYFSQFPDDETKFSATQGFFYLYSLEYRKQIMAVLHSLHGGDQNAVFKRRRDLKSLIRNGIANKSLDDYQIGLIIHAFADSYAHTTIENGKLTAFGYTWGHLFHGHKPDLIAYDPEKYKEYTCELYQALSLRALCSPQLADLHQMIARLEKSRNAELPEFEKYAKFSWGYDQDLYDGVGDQHKKTVQSEEVVKTIKIVEAKIGE
jgi:hypothetical protein